MLSNFLITISIPSLVFNSFAVSSLTAFSAFALQSSDSSNKIMTCSSFLTDVVGQVNEVIGLLDWAVGRGLCLMNTCFQKRKSWLITFRSGETETMINYILVNNKYRSCVKDVKVIFCLLLMEWSSKRRSGGKQNSEKIETVEVERVRGERRVC